jgi:SAM-dependent methyltransferase
VTDRELDRIRREYERRAGDWRLDDGRYASSDPANAAAIAERSATARELLRSHGVHDIASLRVLDAGCGAGGELARLAAAGATAERLVGIDLLRFRVRDAVAALPGGAFAAANAAALPFRDGIFDLVLLFTVLSSVVDARLRTRIGIDVARVLRPGGAVLWYDFRWNPTNRQTTGIGPGEVRRLFPGFEHDMRRVTLAPPIARRLVPRLPRAASAISRVPALRSHTIGLAMKPTEMTT